MRSALLALPLAAAASAQPLQFEECAQAVGLTHQVEFAPSTPEPFFRMGVGLTVADFNRDGWPDIIAGGGGGVPDRVFINRGGTFADETEAWFDTPPHRSNAFATGDVNGDGFEDLFAVGCGDADAPPTPRGSRLYLNRGGERFEEVAANAGVDRVSDVIDGFGAVFGDVDLDGDLDLFVGAWTGIAGGNRLFLNDGTDAAGVPVFRDVSAETGIQNVRVRTFTPRMIDITGDRFPELLVAADFASSRLFVNSGDWQTPGVDRFTDIAGAAGIVRDENAMGATIQDVDNDGDLDWFQTNIYNGFQGFGNTLYLNITDPNDPANPVFVDVAADAGVQDTGWSWGTVFGDYDHDGDLDLAITGGWHAFPPVGTELFRNDGFRADGLTPAFTRVTAGSGMNFIGLGRTLVALDFDRDGDLDLAMSSSSSPVRLYRNVTETAGRGWIQIALDGAQHPCLAADGRHATLEIDAGGRTYHRHLDAGPTYLGQSEAVVHVGLGDDVARLDEIRVRWPDGSARRLAGVDANQRVTIRAFHPADQNDDGRISPADIGGFIRGFLARGDRADTDASGSFDARDIITFIARYRSPCSP